MSVILLIAAIITICIAHILRVRRWELLVEVYEKPYKRNLLQSLSWGYLVNSFVPFKIGDLLRAFLSGRKMKNGKTLGLSTVIVDRYLDVVCVGLVFLTLMVVRNGDSTIANSVEFYLIASVLLILATILAVVFKVWIKKGIKIFAGVFNPIIETKLLRFAWALISNFKDIIEKINKIKLLILTICMWSCYLASYLMYARFISSFGVSSSWGDVFVGLFARNSVRLGTLNLSELFSGEQVSYNIYFMIYMLAPLTILLVISLLLKKIETNSNRDENLYLALLPQLDEQERLQFLENYFSNKNREYLINYLKINRNVFIIRDYSAGSNATTMLCMKNNRTFYRKYAFGEDGLKLADQIRWIKENSEYLNLPEILDSEENETFCYYDMPYNTDAVGLFEYVHSKPVDEGWRIIQGTLDELERTIYQKNRRPSDKETIDKYIDGKVVKNLKRIKDSKLIRHLMEYSTVYINGVEYRNLQSYEKYLNKDFLYQIFKNDSYSVIHGDLTIENIICQQHENEEDGFYIIDPNTGNIHDSSNLDYGKLLQSIHGGYEFLMQTREVSVNGNHINFIFTKSAVYDELHKRLKDYMNNHMSYDKIRSVYFHEVVHWLRLMPYKISKDESRSLMFFAGFLMVLSDVVNMYGQDYEKELSRAI